MIVMSQPLTKRMLKSISGYLAIASAMPAASIREGERRESSSVSTSTAPTGWLQYSLQSGVPVSSYLMQTVA